MNYHYPGYNYLGPGTTDFSRRPINQLDAAAREHDIAYGEIGPSAYYTYNQADEKFLEDIKDIDSFEARAATGFFETKKRLGQYRIIPSNKKDSEMAKRKINWKKTRRGNKRVKATGKRVLRRSGRRKGYRRARQRYSNSFFQGRRALGPPAMVNQRKVLDSGALQASAVTHSFYSFTIGTEANAETCAQNLKYYDVTDAGATVVKTMDLTTVSLSGNIKMLMKTQKKFIRLRNNTTAPTRISIYYMTCNRTTLTSPTGAILNDFNDMYGASLGTTVNVNLLYKLDDCPNLRNFWRVTKTRKGVLNSGSEMQIGISQVRPWLYDPNERDSETGSYRKNISRAVIIEVEGVIFHDTTNTDQVSVSAAQIDYTTLDTWYYSTNNQTRQKFIGLSGGYDTVTVGEFADPQEGKMETYEV